MNCGNLVIENGKLIGYEGEMPSYLVIPNNVKEIGFGAFKQCFNLETIVIPESVKKIERLAFEECINLTSVLLPDNDIELYASAFEKCLSLTKIDIPQGSKVIDEFNFYAHFHENEVVEVPSFVSVIETRGSNGGGIRYNNKEYMKFNVMQPFYKCDAIKFYDHVKWNINIHSCFEQCNKLIMCSYATKKIKRVLWINGHDSKHWGKWGVYKYLTEFANIREGKIVLNGYDSFVMTLAAAKDKSLAMLYRLCYSEELIDENKKLFIAYLKNNKKKVLKYVVDNADLTLLKKADQIGLITKNNVDDLIEYAKNKNMINYLKEWKNKNQC